MPVNEKRMKKLIEQYGEVKGRRMYYMMESKGHPATKNVKGK